MENEENYNKTLKIFGKRLSDCRKHHRITQEAIADLEKYSSPDYYRKHQHLSQQELADLVGYASFQSISNIECGGAPIKRDMAKQFARIFGIEENYFMDVNTEYPTEIEKLDALINEASQENRLMFNAICSLALLNGYTVKLKTKKDIARALGKAKAFGGEGKIADALKDFMVFFRNGKEEFSLSLEDANHFGNHINDVFLSHIKWNIKTE